MSTSFKTSMFGGFDRSDVILTIGGLGPTYDDITRESAAEQRWRRRTRPSGRRTRRWRIPSG